MKYSGIGGQAVIEGVMMRNGKQCAVAVRKPDGDRSKERNGNQSQRPLCHCQSTGDPGNCQFRGVSFFRHEDFELFRFFL